MALLTAGKDEPPSPASACTDGCVPSLPAPSQAPSAAPRTVPVSWGGAGGRAAPVSIASMRGRVSAPRGVPHSQAATLGVSTAPLLFFSLPFALAPESVRVPTRKPDSFGCFAGQPPPLLRSDGDRCAATGRCLQRFDASRSVGCTASARGCRKKRPKVWRDTNEGDAGRAKLACTSEAQTESSLSPTQ